MSYQQNIIGATFYSTFSVEKGRRRNLYENCITALDMITRVGHTLLA